MRVAAGICKAILVVLVAAVCAIPFYIDGYQIGYQLNEFLGGYCDVHNPVETAEHLEWAKILRGNYSVILEEFLAFERSHSSIPRIKDVSQQQNYLDVDPTHVWRTLFLRLYGRDSAHFNEFPRLKQLLSHVPGVLTVLISILDPHYHGETHNGIYRGVHRYLLGLDVSLFLKSNGKPVKVDI